MKTFKIYLTLSLMMAIFYCQELNSQTLLNPTDPASLCADVKPSNITFGALMGINFRNYHQVPAGVDMDDISSFIRYFHLLNESPSGGNGGRDFGNSNPANYTPTLCPTAYTEPITPSTNCFDCQGDEKMKDMRARYCQAKQNGVSTIHAAIEKLHFGNFVDKMFTSSEWGSTLAERYDNARSYGSKFAENYCPSDPTKACLVDIIEIGNEPWGVPGPTDYLAVYRGLIQGINDYYTSTSPTINYTSSTTLNPSQINTSAWRLKASSGAYQFFQETTYWGTNDNVGVIPSDLWPYLEAVNIHPYGFKFNRNGNDEMSSITLDLDQHPESRNGLYLSILNAVKWRNENQASKQLISTEYGWDSQKVGFTAQAVYLVRAMLMAGRFKLDEAVLYEIYDTGDDNSTGLYTTSGLIKVDEITKKESFYAVKRFKNHLGNKLFLDKLNPNEFQDVNSSNDYFAYVVGDANRKPTHLVVWLPENINNGTNLSSQNITISNFPSNFSINTGSTSVKLNGASGSDQTVSTSSIVSISGSSVTIDASPVPYLIPLNSTSYTYPANSANPTITFCGNNNCANQGGDSDGDGVCDNQDCAPNDSSLPTTVGSSCDDGDSNTTNDVIQSDGCTCAGTPIGGGTCAGISVTTSGANVIVSNLFGDNQIVKIHDQNWNQITECNSFNGSSCAPSYTYNGNSNTTYVVTVQIFGSTSCNENYTVTTGSGCTDSDGDGICDPQDCAPNNPNLPTTVGSSCDDGDPNTTNDVIQSDGCTCAGTPIGGGTCAGISVTTSGANVIVSNLFGDNQIVKIHDQNWNQITECNSFNGSSCTPSYTYNGNSNTTYVVTVQIFGSTSCNENYTVTTGSGCTDSDGDGICDPQDCAPNNPNLPTTVGSSCDDGDPNTTNDVIQSDGCTCAGTPIGGGTCAGISVTTSGSDVVVSNLFGDNQIVKIYDQNWNQITDCNSFSGSTCAPTYTYNGNSSTTYVVSVQIFGSTSCNENYTVTTGSNLVSSAENEAQGINQDVSKMLTETEVEVRKPVVIYPNPAENKFHIDMNRYAGKKGNIEIYNNIGSKIESFKYLSIPSEPLSFDIHNYKAGVYIISIQVENQKIISKKITVLK